MSTFYKGGYDSRAEKTNIVVMNKNMWRPGCFIGDGGDVPL